LNIAKAALEELAAVPLEEREVWPDDYDSWHPEKYPPPADVEMIRHDD